MKRVFEMRRRGVGDDDDDDGVRNRVAFAHTSSVPMALGDEDEAHLRALGDTAGALVGGVPLAGTRGNNNTASASRSASPDVKARMVRRRALWLRVSALALALTLDATTPSYDTSRDINIRNSGSVDSWTGIENPIGAFVCARAQSFNAWDGEHFVALSMDGYSFEHQHAFQPGYALAVRRATSLVRWVLSFARVVDVPVGGAHDECLTTLTATALSAYAYSLSVGAMLAFSSGLLKEQSLAMAATYLYAINPANAFFGSAYTESAFAWAQFTAGTLLQENKIVAAGCYFAIATALRSNGILNVLILLTHLGSQMFHTLKREDDAERHKKAARYVRSSVLACLLAGAPYLAFGHYGEWLYCHRGIESAVRQRRPYCRGRSLTNVYGLIPAPLYGFIQKHYWGLGFLSSYTTRNLGNVLLGAPAIALAAYACRRFTVSQNRRLFVKEDQSVFVCSYFAVLGVMTLVAATYMHVQVATRFLSTSPAIYWALAYLGTDSTRWRYWVTFYYLSYASVGVVLFTRFYPWT